MENNSPNGYKESKKGKRKWLKISLIVLAIFAIAGLAFAVKTGIILNKISKGGIFKSILKSVPGSSTELKGEKDGRINVLLLGMRGEDMPGGGLLADSIMVASINIQEKKASLISIPRDLYVQVPDKDFKSKINAVFFYGEQKGAGQGMEDMKRIVSEISGVPIHYAVSINFKGFVSLVDALGGVEITLDKPFDEAMQFNQPHVCDSFFTVPTGKWENKIVKHHEVVNGVSVEVKRKIPMYQLCTAPANTLECGGNFRLPAGKQTLTGEQALCYSRSRETSNDFERAKRQQFIIQRIKEKALSIGTLSDFNKINGILNSLGDNVRTDMEPWEMKKFFDLYQSMGGEIQFLQHVLENSEEGLLYTPEATPETGYILAPRGDNYDRIRELFKNVFSLPSQSDINK